MKTPLHEAIDEAFRELPSIYLSIGKIQARRSCCKYRSARYLELERLEKDLSNKAEELKARVRLCIWIEESKEESK